MVGQSSKRRSVRQSDTRKRSLYLDPETDDDFAISEGEASEGGFVPAASPPAVKKAKTSSKAPARPPQRETRSKAAKKINASSPRKTAGASKRKAKHVSKPTKNASVLPIVPSDGKTPKWESLPYEILVQIFSYALAAEIDMEGGTVATRRAHHPNTWILRTARKVGRAFAEPALTAFYQSPILLAPRWLEDLYALVKQSDESMTFKYKMKVKRLEISSRHLESLQRGGTPWLLPELVSHLPNLTKLVITHDQDEAPFEPIGRSVKWRYATELFDALDAANIRLTEWRWNWHLMADTITAQPWHESSFGIFLDSVHSRKSFQTLRHLTIGHLPSVPPFPELIENQEDPAGVVLAKAIGTLPELKSLSFETCDCLTNQLLQTLPENLERLKIVNCATITSDMLYDFLARSGSSNLLELILDHNPFLDLAFLASLSTLCPRLQVLKMDLYDHRDNHFRHFGQPKYEQLLVEDEIPTWPSSLRTLELVHLSKWGAGTAQNLFRSLVESAESLPDLRRLVLQAHINIAWRDRAAFRDQWIERLCRVYLRQDPEPDARLASFKAWHSWQIAQQPLSASGGRTLSHVAITPSKPSVRNAEQEEERASDSEALSKRRSKRIFHQAITQAVAPPQEPESSQPKGRGRRKRGRRESDAISVASADRDESGEADWRNEAEKVVQGLCSVVDIRIDNQRPREEQFKEDDFMDSEVSGDEEWTEGANVEDDAYAW